MDNYVAYHVHTMLSNAVTNIDSVTTYKQYIQKAVECGMKAIAFSEHGNIFEWVHKKDACDAAGLKYIHAIEAYLTERIPEEGEERVRDNYHCILIARNWDGVKELNKMQSKAFNRTDGHYYYAPRITFDELFASSKNIIVCTACIASALSKGTETAKQKFLNFLLDNKERCFLEVQHHNTDSQRNYNKYLANLSKETGLRLIAATDTHCLNKEHELGRSVLQVSKNTKFDGEDGWDLIWKDYDQLISAFQAQGALTEKEYMTAIQNTNVMADMIEDFTLDRSFKYAKVYDDGEEILRKKLFAPDVINSIAAEGFKREDVEARLEHELDTFKALGATDFILLEDHIIQWEHSHDIWQGPARGSAASSLALYALGITEVNPLKYGFHFWRFMDKSKYSLADIDVDNAPEDRDRVKEWMLNDHLDLPNVKTCEIITFHTEALKGAIRDVGRGLGMLLYEVDEIAKAVHDVSVDENKVTVIDDEWRERYPELFKIVDIVLGTVTSIGSHASGVVISDRDIEEEFGTCYLKDDPYPVSCINMKELDSLNFTKQDALGLENIGVINNTCKLSQIERVSPKNIDFEDDAVWDSMRKDTALIFQMNSDYGQRTMNKIFSDEVYAKIKKEIPSMTKLDLLAFACALVRPCGKGVYEKATSGVVSKTGVKDIDDLLGPSMGYAIMQEPQMAFVQKFCGYTFLESDKLRKCVARGTRVLMKDGSIKAIEDIRVGDMVATYKDGVCSYSEVVSTANNGIKEVVNIKCDGGFNLKCTKDHRILTQRGYVEAQNLTNKDFVFTPKPIEILGSNFITQRIMSIQDCGKEEVYDIGVKDTHNFIANGIVVHNCVAKKLGTREQLPKIKKAWEENAKIRYNLTNEQSEAIIEPFLQCILDATRYSFSLVHSLSYSCISYECGWLRYHYPLEYITSCLNTWNGNDEKTAEAIEYATKKGIKILLPKFRHSKADYFFDKATNSIYRGTSSIKGISASYAEALYELRDRIYNSFIEFLYDAQTIGVPKDQIEALIKLDYFEEFGTIKELSLIYHQFQYFKKGEAKTISKDKLTDKIVYDIVARNANETAKQFNKINCRNILIEIEQYIKSLGLGDADIKTKIQNQMDYMGYIGIKTDKLEDRPRIIVLNVRVLKSAKTNKPWAISMDGQSIGSAKRANYTIRYSLYEKEQFNKCDIIRIRDWERDKRGYYWITNFVKEIC